MIGGGTWEGAPMSSMRRREFVSFARRESKIKIEQNNTDQ